MAARKRSPAKPERAHRVRASLVTHELTKAGTSLDLEIYSKGEKIGELQIGRGGMFWWGGRRHKRKRISWTRFAEEMNAIAYGE